MQKGGSHFLAEILVGSLRGEHAVSEPRPSFASRHRYPAVVNGVCYGYFSSPEAAADTVKFWANNLACEDHQQGSPPTGEAQPAPEDPPEGFT